jgi:hypothetical protein
VRCGSPSLFEAHLRDLAAGPEERRAGGIQGWLLCQSSGKERHIGIVAGVGVKAMHGSEERDRGVESRELKRMRMMRIRESSSIAADREMVRAGLEERHVEVGGDGGAGEGYSCELLHHVSEIGSISGMHGNGGFLAGSSGAPFGDLRGGTFGRLGGWSLSTIAGILCSWIAVAMAMAVVVAVADAVCGVAVCGGYGAGALILVILFGL